MNSQQLKVHISGLEPSDNTELQKALRRSDVVHRDGLAIDVEPRSEGDARHGEPVTLALVLKTAIAVAPPVLNVIAIWLKQRNGRTPSSSNKPPTVEVTLPSGETLTFGRHTESPDSVGDAEQLLKVAQELAKSLPEPQ